MKEKVLSFKSLSTLEYDGNFFNISFENNYSFKNNKYQKKPQPTANFSKIIFFKKNWNPGFFNFSSSGKWKMNRANNFQFSSQTVSTTSENWILDPASNWQWSSRNWMDQSGRLCLYNNMANEHKLENRFWQSYIYIKLLKNQLCAVIFGIS